MLIGVYDRETRKLLREIPVEQVSETEGRLTEPLTTSPDEIVLLSMSGQVLVLG